MTTLSKHPTAAQFYEPTTAQVLTVHLRCHDVTDSIRRDAPKGKLTQTQVQRIADFVTAHLADDVSLPVLAKHLHMSTYHFARLFRRTTGESPHQYVLRQRLTQAQALLQATDIPIVDIALLSGFANQSYLTTVFTQRLGYTPYAYRRRRRG